ncbi:hypothetical protein ACOME3_008887 [Neoechinorhynchus agilis]
MGYLILKHPIKNLFSEHEDVKILLFNPKRLSTSVYSSVFDNSTITRLHNLPPNEFRSFVIIQFLTCSMPVECQDVKYKEMEESVYHPRHRPPSLHQAKSDEDRLQCHGSLQT